MKKIPNSIVILGRRLKIKEGVNLVYMGEHCLGLCDYESKTIYLEKNQSMQSKKEVLLHECAHYLLELSGISQTLSNSENEIYAQLLMAFVQDTKHVL
jgi:Zn-dependent peptidase ImmA (M78 family)